MPQHRRVDGLALLNSRLYTQQEIDERNKFVIQNYDNDFFPSIFQVQDYCFKTSISGPTIQKGLSFALIEPVVGASKPLPRKELNLPM